MDKLGFMSIQNIGGMVMKRRTGRAKGPDATVKGMKASADSLARHITAKTKQWKKSVKV